MLMIRGSRGWLKVGDWVWRFELRYTWEHNKRLQVSPLCTYANMTLFLIDPKYCIPLWDLLETYSYRLP
jgi:hypothetical protein